MICQGEDLYRFLVFAKSCSVKLACKYVNQKNNGIESEETFDKMLLLNSYIYEIETYLFACCDYFLKDGQKNYNGVKIFMSTKNSLYLISEDHKLKVSSDDLNCLTEEEICSLANKIRQICSGC